MPPLELCKQIPTGKFEASALVWVTCGDMTPKFRCVDKWKFPFIPEEGAVLYPAPTLQEILADLAKGNEVLESHSPELNYNDFCGGWIVRGRTLNVKGSEVFPDWIDMRDKNNPVTAALSLWLRLNSTKQEEEIQ